MSADKPFALGPSMYKCTKHPGVWLVPRITTIVKRGHSATLYFFACPVNGCKFAKPNKWRKTI
jgi:hypothetical protein